MADNSQETAQQYRQLVEDYESIGEDIQILIRKYGGHTENMTPDAMRQYRQLATQRDELYNKIKIIEADWFKDE